MQPTTRHALILAAVLLAPAALPAQQEPGPAPNTVKDVMTVMTIPASDVVFGAASDPPDTKEEWAALRKAADTLAASGRLLQRKDLARDTKAWMEMARALVTSAEALAAIADRGGRDRLEQAGDQIYATCETCHARYLPQ